MNRLRLFGYHLRLTLRSLVRDRSYSLAMVICLGAGASFWSLAMAHFLRLYGPDGPVRPTLHHVELAHVRPEAGAVPPTHSGQVLYAWRLRLSYPEYHLLSGSGIPHEEIALARARLVVDGRGDRGIVPARFVSAGFFDAFRRRMRFGRAWTAADELAAGGLAQVVLSRGWNERLFGGTDSVGQTVRVEGRPFVVRGVLAEDQPFRPDWDIAMTGADQDGLYLPFGWFERLHAWPEGVAMLPPSGSSFADLLRSTSLFVTFWIDLPTPEHVARYAQLLSERLGPRGRTFQLRSIPEFRRTFGIAGSPILFFALLGGLVLLGGGFNFARLQLAKIAARADEVAIHRALGAHRSGIFLRQMVETTLLSLAAAALALTITAPFLWWWRTLVNDSDVPLRLSMFGLAVTTSGTLLVGLASGLYPSWRLSRVVPTPALGRR